MPQSVTSISGSWLTFQSSSRKDYLEHLSNLVPKENFNAHYPAVYLIQDKHSRLRFQRHIAMTRPVATFWFSLRVEGRAEIVSAATSLDYLQCGYLNRKSSFTSSGKKLFELLRK